MVTPRHTRGQLILIGALLVAATVVSSVVLLNSIHESPEVNSEQDAQGVGEAERTIDHVQSGLERVFLVSHSADTDGKPLPYAVDAGGGFGSTADLYVQQYNNVSTADSAGLVTVDVVSTETGAIAYQTKPSDGYKEYPSGTVLTDADYLPRLSMYVNKTNATAMELKLSGSVTETLRISDDDVRKIGDWTCDLNGDDGPIKIDFVNGVGSVSTNETYCGPYEFGTSLGSNIDVKFNDGSNANGTYTITGVNATAKTITPGTGYRESKDSCGTGNPCIVNPTFEVTYRNPNIVYNSTFALYNRSAP